MYNNKIKVLFVCTHNSARSQMAAALLDKIGNGKYDVDSAGLEAGELNPFVVRVLQEIGIDISGNTTKSVFDLFTAGRRFHYVITVCDESSKEKCPVFPGLTKRLHWSFDDPAVFKGSDEEIMNRVRDLRHTIQHWVELFEKEISTLEQLSLMQEQ